MWRRPLCAITRHRLHQRVVKGIWSCWCGYRLYYWNLDSSWSNPYPKLYDQDAE